MQTLRERYGEQAGQLVADATWIEEATRDGYVLLHKDKRIRRQKIECRTLVDVEARSFALSTGSLSGAAASDRVIRNWPKIARAIARRPGPFFYVILENDIELRRLDW